MKKTDPKIRSKQHGPPVALVRGMPAGSRSDYAVAYWNWLVRPEPKGPCPDRGGLSYIAAFAIRNRLESVYGTEVQPLPLPVPKDKKEKKLKV